MNFHRRTSILHSSFTLLRVGFFIIYILCRETRNLRDYLWICVSGRLLILWQRFLKKFQSWYVTWERGKVGLTMELHRFFCFFDRMRCHTNYCIDIVGRNSVLVTHGSWRVKVNWFLFTDCFFLFTRVQCGLRMCNLFLTPLPLCSPHLLLPWIMVEWNSGLRECHLSVKT